MKAPILKYPGAKWRIAAWIIGYFPPHLGYLEPFLGSGAVFFNKPRSEHETINDLDGCIPAFFRVVRERPDELARALYLTPWSRDELIGAWLDDPSLDELERARRTVVRCWMTKCRLTGSAASFARRSGARDSDSGNRTIREWDRVPRLIYETSERLKDAQIENRPALDILRAYNGPEILVYLDPPYMPSTLNSSKGGLYRCGMTESDHEELLKTLLAHEGMIFLSGYSHPMYHDMLRGWYTDTHGEKSVVGSARTEVLWWNPHAEERRRLAGIAGDS